MIPANQVMMAPQIGYGATPAGKFHFHTFRGLIEILNLLKGIWVGQVAI